MYLSEQLSTHSLFSFYLAAPLTGLLQVNDETPQFVSKIFEANIMENATVGTFVVQALARDNDDGLNAQINYTFVSGNVDNVFGIDPTLGFIYVAKPLNARNQPEYYLVVKASDLGSPPLSSSVNVHVTVSSPDKSKPQFDRKQYYAEIKEDEKPGKVLTMVKARSTQSLRYEIVDGNKADKFAMNTYNGEVWLKEELDFETQRNYELTLSATNMDGIVDNAKLMVNVADVNDNAPAWNNTFFTGHISESAIVGSCVSQNELNLPLVVKAYDRDATQNALLSYHINEPYARQHFMIDAKNGLLCLRKRFEPDPPLQITLSISAADLGIPTLKSAQNAVVKVHIDPQVAPILHPFKITINSYLDEFPGGIIGQLTAHDDDPYDSLTFALANEELRQLFEINPETGVITALPGLDVGKHQINVSVTDGKFTVYEIVDVHVQLISEEMVENGLLIRIESVSTQRFVSFYKKFIRNLKNMFGVKSKDINILSVHSVVNRSSEHENLVDDESGDLNVAFAVAKQRNIFFSPVWLKEKFVAGKGSLVKQMEVGAIEVIQSGCWAIVCEHGDCRDEIHMNDKKVISIMNERSSFVFHHLERKTECVCHPGE